MLQAREYPHDGRIGHSASRNHRHIKNEWGNMSFQTLFVVRLCKQCYNDGVRTLFRNLDLWPH